MQEINIGTKLRAVFVAPLPGNDIAPPLNNGEEYVCKGIHIDSKGNLHVGVGLPMNVNWVKSYATGEILPSTQHWCHPNRFIII